MEPRFSRHGESMRSLGCRRRPGDGMWASKGIRTPNIATLEMVLPPTCSSMRASYFQLSCISLATSHLLTNLYTPFGNTLATPQSSRQETHDWQHLFPVPRHAIPCSVPFVILHMLKATLQLIQTWTGDLSG